MAEADLDILIGKSQSANTSRWPPSRKRDQIMDRAAKARKGAGTVPADRQSTMLLGTAAPSAQNSRENTAMTPGDQERGRQDRRLRRRGKKNLQERRTIEEAPGLRHAIEPGKHRARIAIDVKRRWAANGNIAS